VTNYQNGRGGRVRISVHTRSVEILKGNYLLRENVLCVVGFLFFFFTLERRP